MKRIRRAYSKTVSLINETAVQIYENYIGRQKGFLLESYDKNNGRYVFMGKNPEEIIHTEGDCLVIRRADGEVRRLDGNPVDRLKAYCRNFEIRKSDESLVFTGGLVGALGYDFVRFGEELPDENPDEIGIDTIQLMLVTESLTIDHLAETMTAVVIDEDDPRGEERALKKCSTMLEEALQGLDQETAEREKIQPDGRILKQSDNLEEYSEKVNKIKHYIVEGHVFQTVLSQRWTIETGQDGFSLYKELREINPSQYMYYFRFEDFEIIGSSPERVVKLKRDKVFTNPIAGTRKRGADPQEDEKLAEDLLKDPKERAEHVMLVDLARNDMGRIAEFGTVKVKDFMQIQKYSHVMHIVTLVEGKKKGSYHPIDLISSFLPAGTLSGAPKIRAMEIIDELESVRRGLYGGAIGYIDFSGDMDFCITIRTMVKKGNIVYLQAGAGIVADSDPACEYEECCNKVKALASILVKEEDL